jgi:hypothetical protein
MWQVKLNLPHWFNWHTGRKRFNECHIKETLLMKMSKTVSLTWSTQPKLYWVLFWWIMTSDLLNYCSSDNLYISFTLGPTQPPIQWLPGALSLGVKRPGREADHSPPTNAEIKNAWSYTSTLPVHLHGVVLSKSQGQAYYLPLAVAA